MREPLSGRMVADALARTSHALATRPDYAEAARLLAALLQRYELNAGIDVSPRGLHAAFAFADVDRQALCKGALDYLKGRPPLADLLARGRSDGWEEAAERLARKDQKLLRDRLFAAALVHGVVADDEVEYLLTAFRRHLLIAPQSLQSRPVYEFACRLIRQCLNNGYVFFADADERERLAGLAVDIDAMLAGDASEGGAFILRSLYRPFHELLDLEPHSVDKVSPHTLRDMLGEELEARRSEAALADSLPRLSAPADETSRRVAGQYAVDPYPRWLSLQAPAPGSAGDRMRVHFADNNALAILNEPCDVLIAGAGTGRQAIDAAIAYGDEARVLAIDLSAPSLAYGARMAETLGVANLRFAVGDILSLDERCGDFDLIECVGVLHHLADPFEGWRALVRRLRPGGLMLVGLYSAVSREVIRTLSDDPDWPGPDADDDALRAYRRTLLTRPSGEDEVPLTQSPDFWTRSGFRDLVLHASEQQCTIPEIRDFLAAEGLDFHGFILPDDPLRAYAAAFPDDSPPDSLDSWWAFEQDNPRTFSGMYLFWCRRKATA